MGSEYKGDTFESKVGGTQLSQKHGHGLKVPGGYEKQVSMKELGTFSVKDKHSSELNLTIGR